MPPFGSLRKTEHCLCTLMDRSSGVWAALYQKLLIFPSSGAHSRVGFARAHDNRIHYAGAVQSNGGRSSVIAGGHEILVQPQRHKAAAVRLLRKLLRRHGFVTTVIIRTN